MEIAYISGLQNSIPAKKVQNIAIDVAAWNQAEFYLLMVKRRFEILYNYYGLTEYNDAIIRIENAITNDFIVKSSSTSIGNTANEAINYAKALYNPIDTQLLPLVDRDQKLQSFGLNNIVLGTFIPALDRDKWVINEMIRIGYGKLLNGKLVAANGSISKTAYVAKLNEVQHLFESFVKFRDGLNKQYENVGHHLLYEFANGDNPTQVITKSILHKQSIDVISKIVQIQRETISIWTENSIMKQNTAVGLQPYQAAETIAALKENAGKIGSFDPKTVIDILKAVAIALTAAAGLAAAIKGTPEGDYMSSAQGFSTENFGPQSTDFPVGTGSSGGSGLDLSGNSNLLPYLLLGGGALYLLTNNK